jgi:hypothetical protein
VVAGRAGSQPALDDAVQPRGQVTSRVSPESSGQPRFNDINGPSMSLAAKSQQLQRASDAAGTASLTSLALLLLLLPGKDINGSLMR